MRQTNIVWIFGFSFLALYNHIGSEVSTRRMISGIKILWIQLMTGILFFIFLVWNKFSIVLGHHEFHSTSFHYAQINYLILVIGVLVWPVVISGLLRRDRRRVVGYILVFIASVLVSEFGTIAHPFILSDNRHYTFYFYRRFLNARWMRSLLVPLAVTIITFSVGHHVSNPLSSITRNQRLGWMIFAFCVAITCIPTPLIEFRYFNVPIVFVSIEISKSLVSDKRGNGSGRYQLGTILLTSVLVNFVVMYVFLFRPFTNSDGSIGRFMY
jgi:alpha-1,2-glucosyltransferase